MGGLGLAAAAAFDDITRNKRVNLMERSTWPATFRTFQLMPAVDYIQALRLRGPMKKDCRKASPHASRSGTTALIAIISN